MATVAFSCRLTDNIHSLDAGNPIKFIADVNLADSYSNGTGIFTAPEEGHYFLAYTIAHRNMDSPLTVKLLVNGNAVSSAVAEKVDYGKVTQSGNQAVVYMQEGNTSQVVVGDPGAINIIGGEDRFTSFCGYKIC